MKQWNKEGGGSLDTPKNDDVIYGRPLIEALDVWFVNIGLDFISLESKYIWNDKNKWIT